MIFRDTLEAEHALFGTLTYTMSVRRRADLDRAEHLGDMADAWLAGDFERAEVLMAKHEAKIRSTPVLVKKASSRASRGRGLRKWGRGHAVIDRSKVLELAALGWRQSDIVRYLGCSKSRVSEILKEAA